MITSIIEKEILSETVSVKKDDADQTRYETQQNKEEPSTNKVIPNNSSSASSDLVHIVGNRKSHRQ